MVYFDDQPPAIDESHARLANRADLAGLAMPDPLGGGRMHDRVLAAALFRERAGDDKLIEGWVEGPCAEGADLRGINALMVDFYDDPVFVHDLFAFNVEMGIAFARAQVEAGADIIGVGDAAASLVGPHIYGNSSSRMRAAGGRDPRAQGSRVRLHLRQHVVYPAWDGAAAVKLWIWIIPRRCPPRARRWGRQVLLGMEPGGGAQGAARWTKWRRASPECHRDAGDPYIAGAGCEIPRGTPPENVHALRSMRARSGLVKGMQIEGADQRGPGVLTNGTSKV